MKKSSSFVHSCITVLLILTATFIFATSFYISKEFPDQNIDEMIFYVVSGLKGTSSSVLYAAAYRIIVPLLVLFLLWLFPILRTKNTVNSIELNIKDKKIRIHLFSSTFIYKYRAVYAFVIVLFSVSFSYKSLQIGDYINRLSNYSNYIEDHSAKSENVALHFPDKKRNLIILYVESLENSMLDQNKGGGWSYPVMPELEDIAEKHINFSDSEKIGGALPISGTGWTVAGLVATTSGLPLKIPINGNDYTSSTNFMAGAFTLGDILAKEGYHQAFMAGSDFEYGGRKNYYLKHGNFKIYDVKTAIAEGKIKENEQVWWGFDDSLLFSWAKEEITSLAHKDQPFSFSLLTANTHFTDGYLEKNASSDFDTQYENVHAYSSKQISDFVNWFMEQEFYDSTSLVILGDHLSMQPNGFFTSRIYEGYSRTIFNTFINPSNEPKRPKNRQFTQLDMFPTILSSIGVEIEGEHLGLGTNLFSGTKTLVEKAGLSFVDAELAKNSNYYNLHILQDDYLQLIDQAKE